MDESVLVVMGVLFSKRLVGERLAMWAMDPNLTFLGDMALLLNILFWVYSFEESMVIC